MMNTKLIHDFVDYWTGKGYEKGENQPFWSSLLRLLGIEQPEKFITHEQQVHFGNHTAFLDGYIPTTKVLIEQKSINKDLGIAYKQSDDTFCTPFEQAKRYANQLPHSMQPRWIVTCNFREFWVYDMEQPNAEPQKILLENLEKEYHRLMFLVKKTDGLLKQEEDINVQAGGIINKIYTAIRQQYTHPDAPDTLQSLNQLCVRLVFLFFAEDAGLFGGKNEFHDFIAPLPANKIRQALIDLFKVLDTPTQDRDPYLDDDLKVFSYVNGGLFSNENIEIPQFTDEIKNMILVDASEKFDWSAISPTIFGAVFESTLNPETRRSGGMHYTSIENIHKVIDPLFMDDLYEEFDACQTNKDYSRFQDKLASLTFFDPACGSGNFLTETYVSLRKLENKVIQKITNGQTSLFADPVKVNIHQFYGIEINDFAVSVATTALWIAELQMMRETELVANFDFNPLPLHTYRNIHEGNALRMDWKSLTPHAPSPDGEGEISTLNYIMGNPPFVGHQMTNDAQKKDIVDIFGKDWKNVGRLDYVSCWYKKAMELMQLSPQIKAALVSTNSITQGEQVPILWAPFNKLYNIQINFAYPTFRWDSESSLKAHVHCVIIGFSVASGIAKRSEISGISVPHLYLSDGTYKQCSNINGYLLDAPNIYIDSTSKPLCNVPEIRKGNQPTDGGNLIIEASDYEEFISKEPSAVKYIKKLLGAEEFINSKKRYCLWLVDISPSDLRAMPLVMERVRKVREMRLASTDVSTRRKADLPHLFRETNNPNSYIVIPSTSSENRIYVPLGFLDGSTIPTNANLIIPSATLYHFGILTSNVHMSWMRAVCGRLKSDYRYSKDIVYNNFPWPTPTEEQQAKIEQTAQAILDARALYPESSLADLYDEVSMPVELRRAHQANDRAVMEAYGFDTRMSESDCVARLLEMYQAITKPLPFNTVPVEAPMGAE